MIEKESLRYLNVNEPLTGFIGKEVLVRWSVDWGDDIFWEKGILVSGEPEASYLGKSEKGRWTALINGVERIFQFCAIKIKHDVKQVIVMRRDLKCRRGKEISQGCHASMSFLVHRLQHSGHSGNIGLSKPEQEWLDGSFTKVCVRVDSEEQLMDIYQKAKDAMLEVHLITDLGKTEFHGVSTKTCLAIGPDYSHNIDPITGQLQLL